MTDGEYRDSHGRTFPEFVADNVQALVVTSGFTISSLARECGIERTRLGDRLHNKRPFTTWELACVAFALEVNPTVFTDGFEPV